MFSSAGSEAPARMAIDLTKLVDGHGRWDSARTLLHHAFDKFADGSNATDLETARRLLAGLD
jgi:hypothetical protein